MDIEDLQDVAQLRVIVTMRDGHDSNLYGTGSQLCYHIMVCPEPHDYFTRSVTMTQRYTPARIASGLSCQLSCQKKFSVELSRTHSQPHCRENATGMGILPAACGARHRRKARPWICWLHHAQLSSLLIQGFSCRAWCTPCGRPSPGL